MMTMMPSTATLSRVGVTAIVRMMSAATRSSNPSRIERPRNRRNFLYASRSPLDHARQSEQRGEQSSQHDCDHSRRVD